MAILRLLSTASNGPFIWGIDNLYTKYYNLNNKGFDLYMNYWPFNLRILKISQTKGLRDPKCGCTFEPFGFIKAVGNQKGELIHETINIYGWS